MIKQIVAVDTPLGVKYQVKSYYPKTTRKELEEEPEKQITTTDLNGEPKPNG